MKIQLPILFFLLTTLSIHSQNKKNVNEVVVDKNGKVLSKSTNKKEKIYTPDEILNSFYSNQNNINFLSKMISFRFYQKTPFVKFKDIMETKNNFCGKLIKKEIIEKEYSNNNLAIRYKLYVEYEKRKTTEQVVLIKESESSNFEVFDYNIKTN
ncbi:hypothetical protein [Flavobacterium oreochromis]|uniref:Uncharacterized protein n=2 Tax=Flavobacterium TaxID=237 RepID=A0A246G9R1_9FLAO|nr:hypothetical protein [Flavobacterium oreochromis]OWP76451.1 hypothetical protein BWK62_09670 [Flavobacterium oreochromis]